MTKKSIHGKAMDYLNVSGFFFCFCFFFFFFGGGLISGESWSVCPSTLSVMFLSISYRVLLC